MMKWSIHILGSVAAFAGLTLVAACIDAVLHLCGLVWLGRWAGPVGTLLILVSMTYSARKRNWITAGAPRALLRWHELASWTGTALILIHAGIHVHAALPWLATAALLVTVASGLTGRHLLGRARKELGGHRKELVSSGLSPSAVEAELAWQSAATDAMRRWRDVHLPITTTLVVLSTAHILTSLVFWVS